ncbi:MAG TPA: hypothetical protein VMF65_18150 [Acidimicrobiales bacterium]|nr:hypothetical protein [Acidimicrobiales bacterium]
MAGSPTADGPTAGQKAKPAGWPRALVLNLLIWVGSLFVLGSSVIHFHLWDSYAYRALPTIGPLFLMQSIVGAVLAIWTSVARKLLLVLAETGFAFSTAGALIISVNFGLFGWKDTMSAPYAGLALAVEFTAGALLLAASGLMGTEWLAERKGRSVSRAAGAGPARNADAGDGPPPSRPVGPRPAPQA